MEGRREWPGFSHANGEEYNDVGRMGVRPLRTANDGGR